MRTNGGPWTHLLRCLPLPTTQTLISLSHIHTHANESISQKFHLSYIHGTTSIWQLSHTHTWYHLSFARTAMSTELLAATSLNKSCFSVALKKKGAIVVVVVGVCCCLLVSRFENVLVELWGMAEASAQWTKRIAAAAAGVVVHGWVGDKIFIHLNQGRLG